jgi:hypothetical protein
MRVGNARSGASLQKSILGPQVRPHAKPMNPSTSFAMIIATAQSLVAMVNTRDGLHLRPEFARQAIAARLKSGLIVLRTFLRRLIILIALDLEWGLVDTRGEMKRPHGRKSKPSDGFHLPNLDAMSGGIGLIAIIQIIIPEPKAKRQTGLIPQSMSI